MNALSLAYSNAQKQTSWSDDPFELKGFVTGVTKISDHERNLRDYTQELVYSYGVRHDDHYELVLDKLSTPCQMELARLYIESIDREIEWACYGDDQSINSDFLCAMLAMLKDSNPETRDNFAQVTSVNLFKYYQKTLQELIDEACHVFYCNEMENAGMQCYQDRDNGEFLWSK